jgi:transposase-like protein
LFQPPYCPNQSCPTEVGTSHFQYRRRGFYKRKCDGRRIPRFLCTICGRGFSSQTFRGNYRYRLPTLHHQLMVILVSKVTRRQAARVLRVNRKTVERRFKRFARVARDFHFAQLNAKKDLGGIRGSFQLDELETFEHNRRIKPVTLAVTMEQSSYFVMGAYAGTMACRGNLTPRFVTRKTEIVALEGKRKSQSRQVVKKSFEVLANYLACNSMVHLQSDQKTTYPVEFRRAFPDRLIRHEVTSSKVRRNYANPLFPVNHTLAMMRDGLSCLVRRNWAASKKKSGLARHCWIWIAWRNYVRGITNRTKTTPAQALGVSAWAFTVMDLYRWRWPLRDRPRHI